MADEPLGKAIDQLQAYFKLMPDWAAQSAQLGLRDALLWLQGEIAAQGTYPPEVETPAGVVQRMSPKARAWFFWAVRMGKLPGWRWVKDEAGGHPEGHYRRTGKLMASLTSEVKRSKQEIVGVIGFGMNYAPWVVGPAYPGATLTSFGQTRPMYQARVHEGRWFRFDEQVEKRREELNKIFFEEFTREFEQLISKH